MLKSRRQTGFLGFIVCTEGVVLDVDDSSSQQWCLGPYSFKLNNLSFFLSMLVIIIIQNFLNRFSTSQ